MKAEFTERLSYNRFVEQQRPVMLPLLFFMHSLPKAETGMYFVDSTPIDVCPVKREKQHKVLCTRAAKSRSTMGGFFGFKRPIVVNSVGDLMAVKLTKATTDDRKAVPELTRELFGKGFGDKGYISKMLKATLYEKGLD